MSWVYELSIFYFVPCPYFRASLHCRITRISNHKIKIELSNNGIEWIIFVNCSRSFLRYQVWNLLQYLEWGLWYWALGEIIQSHPFLLSIDHFWSYLHFKVVGAGFDLTVQVTSYCTRENAVWLYSQNIFGETKTPNSQNLFLSACIQRNWNVEEH